MKHYAGLDPGTKGGLTIINEDREVVTALRFSQSTWEDVARAISEALPIEFVLLELVSAMPGDGGSSMFKFGTAYGVAQGLLTGLAVPYELVRPLKWQKALGITLPKGTDAVRKKHLQTVAQRLYPDDKRLVRENADSYLLAELCRRWMLGTMGAQR